MTETQASPEQQAEPSPAEPLYGAQDVAAALDTSGERAMATHYFSEMSVLGIPKVEADAMIQAIKSGQPYPPQPGGQSVQSAEAQPTEAPPPDEPPAEGGAA